MFCVNCGARLPEGAKFCLECGWKVGEIEGKQNNLDEELSYCIMELNNHYTDETDLKTIRDKGAFRIVDLWMGGRLYRIEHKEED